MRILQARILEWVALPFSRGSSWPRDQTHVSYVSLHWQMGSLLLVPPGKPIYTHTYVYTYIHTYMCIYIYITCACVHVKLLQSCAALCDAADCSLSGSSVHGILHEKILEWVSMPSSTGSSQPRIEPYICCIHIWNWFTFLYTWHCKYNIVNQLYANNIF